MKKKITITCMLLCLCMAAAAVFTGCGSSSSGSSGEETTASSLPELNVYCFQARKADAFLFYTGKSAVLIDTGESGFGKTIVEKCAELEITALDYLIVTHFDQDHVGGAKKVLAEMTVSNVLQSNYTKDSSEYEKYASQLKEKGLTAQTVREELTFTLDGVTYTVNPPKEEVYSDSESNNSSLIVTVAHGENKMLFMGDAEDLRLKEFLETDPPACKLIKLPHHGRWHEPLTDLIKKTSPQYAVITSSDEEQEDDETLALLKKQGVTPFLTRTAPVLITDNGSTLQINYCR